MKKKKVEKQITGWVIRTDRDEGMMLDPSVQITKSGRETEMVFLDEELARKTMIQLIPTMIGSGRSLKVVKVQAELNEESWAMTAEDIHKKALECKDN